MARRPLYYLDSNNLLKILDKINQVMGIKLNVFDEGEAIILTAHYAHSHNS